MARTKCTARKNVGGKFPVASVAMNDLLVSYLGDSAQVLQLEAEWRFKAGKQLSQFTAPALSVADKLAALPEAIMHHLLKLIGLRGLARLALTSRSWARHIAFAASSSPKSIFGRKWDTRVSKAAVPTVVMSSSSLRLLSAVAAALHPCEIVMCNAFRGWTMEGTAELMSRSLQRAAWSAPLVMEMATRSALSHGFDFRGFDQLRVLTPKARQGDCFLRDVGAAFLTNLGHFASRLHLHGDAMLELFRFGGAGLLPPRANAIGLVGAFIHAGASPTHEWEDSRQPRLRLASNDCFSGAGKALGLSVHKLMPLSPEYLVALLSAVDVSSMSMVVINSNRVARHDMVVSLLRTLLNHPNLPASWGIFFPDTGGPFTSFHDEFPDRWLGSSAGALLALAAELPLRHEIATRGSWEECVGDAYDPEAEAAAAAAFVAHYGRLGQMSQLVPPCDIPLILERMADCMHVIAEAEPDDEDGQEEEALTGERVGYLIDQFLKGCWLDEDDEDDEGRLAAIRGVKELTSRVSDHIKYSLERWLTREETGRRVDEQAHCNIM